MRYARLNFVKSYRRHVREIRSEVADERTGMELAVGGEFEAMGRLERDLLIAHGLRSDSSVADIGCGSGRLALPLSEYLSGAGAYLGTDVVPELLDYARRLVNRPDWRFELVTGLNIQAPDASFDFVCFFSVFTHLLHEESYRYLEEARRVVRPSGKIVFSFLEFAVPDHWQVFESNLAAIGSQHHLNQFMSWDGVRAWADHLRLELVGIWRGDEAHIPLTAPVVRESGTRYEKLGTIGQSVAVLRR
ncbi:MAG: class I SAM-dependent methyltransferase [Acidimicrobiia bacterium]